jgi:hypothetical protein
VSENNVPIGVDRGQSPLENLPASVPARPLSDNSSPTVLKEAETGTAQYDYPPDYLLNGAGETVKRK